MRLKVLALLIAAATLCGPSAAWADWKALRNLEKQGARVGALVVDLDSGQSLQKLHADTRLSPASITKLVVAAAALDTWHADKTFQTTVRAAGTVRDGHLTGDLVLTGEGDATLEHRDLWLLAAQVRHAGVQSVSGKLVVRPPFGPLNCDNRDRCDALEHSDTAYNVPLAGLAVDYGTWCVEVRPVEVGRPAQVRACGGFAMPIAVEGSITTLSGSAKENYWVERRTRDGVDFLQVGGAIALGSRGELFRAMSDPARGAGLLLRQMLRDSGVRVDGEVVVSHEGDLAEGPILANVPGLLLKEQLARMLRHSNNYIADLLTLSLAHVAGTPSTAQLSEASAVLADFVRRSGRKGADAPRLFSGSGLTPENEISAAEMVRMLEAEYRDTRNFPAFYGGMVVPRQAPYAFLRNGGSRAWLDRVALKTGTLNDPRSVSAVAGYLRRKDGGWMAFAIMVNGSERVRRVPLYKSMEAIKSDIDDLLERY